MPQPPLIPVCFWQLGVIVVFLLPTIWGLAAEPDAEEKAIAVRLIVSDHKILRGDWVGYKLIITNHLESTVQLCDIKNPAAREIKQFVECRKPGGEWKEVQENFYTKQGGLPRAILIDGKQDRWFYEQIFLDKEREFVFADQGEYEVRIRLKCLLGEFVTDPVTISVEQRGEKELARLHKGRHYMEFFLDPQYKGNANVLTQDLEAALSGGSVKRSLELLDEFNTFQETGRLGGKELGLAAAHARLTKDLDDVRHHQLSKRFLRLARERRNWPELALLLDDPRLESGMRADYAEDLKIATRAKIPPQGSENE